MLYLEDPISLSDAQILVPPPLVPLLGLCDGSREPAELRSEFERRTGATLDDEALKALIEALESALLLEGPRFESAVSNALAEYRAAPHRRPHHADLVYPSGQEEFRRMIAGFCEAAPAAAVGEAHGRLVGMLCPHIDFARGWRTYAQTWQAASAGLTDIERVVILGTDHRGGEASLTLTRQDYLTPLGTLATEVAVVDRIALAIGCDRAFSEELHHRSEHSVELASVWMHSFMERREPELVPVLCSQFPGIDGGTGHPRDDPHLEAGLDVLASAVAERPTLVIAAADLAHVGPAFGDPEAVGGFARHALENQDQESLAAFCSGDAAAFLALSVRDGNARRVCGLSPMYLALEVLRRAFDAPVSGVAMGYDQRPADRDGGSFVSIAGALLYG